MQAHCTCVRNSVAIEHTLDSTTTECVLNQITCRLLGVPQLMRYTAYHVTASPFVEYRVTAFLGLSLSAFWHSDPPRSCVLGIRYTYRTTAST